MKVFRYSVLFVFVVFSVFIFCQRQSESATPVEPGIIEDSIASADGLSIDGLLDALYGSITFSEGEVPDMKRFKSLFIPNAPFIRITPDGPNTMDLESFVSSFKERVRSNALKSFYEAEIARKTHLFGGIAQVFSTYKKGMNTDDPESLGRGINSLQLFHDGKRWWVCCITWEDESPDNPIPEKYLR